MHPVIDKVILQSQNKKVSFAIYHFLLSKLPHKRSEGSQLSYLTRFGKFLSNAEKFFPEASELYPLITKREIFNRLAEAANSQDKKNCNIG